MRKRVCVVAVFALMALFLVARVALRVSAAPIKTSGAAVETSAGQVSQSEAAGNPGCERETAQECLKLAMEAMGGRERLEQVKSVRLETTGQTLLMEQSYRQDPFIASYESGHTTIDFANGRMSSEMKETWPEADANQWESDSHLVADSDGGVERGKDSDSRCSLAELDEARDGLALGPARLLLTAASASDLRFGPPETLRSTPHTTLEFSWRGFPVRILLNRFNHLPDAVEATREFHDFWYFWGDVHQRVYFDNWKMVQGIRYPTNLVEERNGTVWRSTQALNVELNVPTDNAEFRMDPRVAKQSAASVGWKREFRAGKDTILAPGVDLFPGAWNSTIVKQADGIVILEAPISEPYTKGVIDEAKRRYPEIPIKAVLSTSDSWPHTGGVRFAVSQQLPVYILDLNRPLLDRMVAAPHRLDPDALEKMGISGGAKKVDWRIVSGKVEVGSGTNRIELYPLRGASTERQYMVYFPEHRLLYASDTLAFNDDNSLYDPELMNEVVEAARREKLEVNTVFAMHTGPTPWAQVLELIKKSQGS